MADKIGLTPERAAIIERARDEWLTVGLSTEPADFNVAEKAMAGLYKSVGRKRPYFVRLDSPLAAEIYLNLLAQIWPKIKDQLRDQLRGQLRDQLWGQLWDQLRDQLRDQQMGFHGTWAWGSWDAYFWGWADTGRQVGATYPLILDKQLDAWCAVARSCGWVYPFADFCILTNRPEILRRNAEARLHCESGPAICYRDGYSLWAINGVRLPQMVVERPDEISVEAIDKEENAEVRRVMIERYAPGRGVTGAAAYIVDSGAAVIDRDETALADPIVLYRKEVEDDEPIVMLAMKNSTPEPDGRVKDYFLRVPPGMTRALDAMAWTFNLAPGQYRPKVET